MSAKLWFVCSLPSAFIQTLRPRHLRIAQFLEQTLSPNFHTSVGYSLFLNQTGLVPPDSDTSHSTTQVCLRLLLSLPRDPLLGALSILLLAEPLLQDHASSHRSQLIFAPNPPNPPWQTSRSSSPRMLLSVSVDPWISLLRIMSDYTDNMRALAVGPYVSLRYTITGKWRVSGDPSL